MRPARLPATPSDRDGVQTFAIALEEWDEPSAALVRKIVEVVRLATLVSRWLRSETHHFIPPENFPPGCGQARIQPEGKESPFEALELACVSTRWSRHSRPEVGPRARRLRTPSPLPSDLPERRCKST